MKTLIILAILLSAFISNAQRTMFGAQNNYVAPVVPFQAPPIVTNGLVLYLDAGNYASYPGTGATWTDLSVNGNIGTFIGATSYSNADGGTMVFNGNGSSNDYISVANNTSLNLTTAGSISIWIKPNTLTQLGLTNLISRTIDGAPNGQSYYVYWTSGNITGIIQNGGVYKSISTPVPTAIGWYNYVFTWGNGYLNLFRNGVSVATPISSLISAQILSTTLNIGGYVFGGAGGNANTFNGKIPFVTLYNREITPAEVLTNFNAVKTRYGL
ncbi:MAG: Synechococcus phage [Bacteroidota bacterium]